MTIAPIAPEDLERSLRDLGEATMFPSAAYTDPAVLAFERRHFFAGSWVCVGRNSDLRSPKVTQRGLMIGDIPVILTWNGDDLRAFANTCRHRGHELLPDGETSGGRGIACPYHGWGYALDGSLIATPNMELNGSKADFSLRPLPLAEWQGWVFINATGDAAPFAEHLGAMDEYISPYSPADLVVADRHSYVVNANWKLIVENYHECYHCPSIHPELCEVTPPDSGDNMHGSGAWVGGSMYLRDGMDTMSLDGKSTGHNLPGVDPTLVLYLGLFPNLLISPHPDYVMAHRMLPLDVDRTWVECTWLFPADVEDVSYGVKFWDITNRQDWAACESVQRGVTSPHFVPGPFADSEDAVHQWVRLVGRAYQGQAPHRQQF
ncbi:MAG TPA: aromatic ring-hydroxylating dioxygenase subunit alpha [Actinomycetes bacterium]|nr:aromatic ring-hydroxylating dioxygenase subunit alpha [Actinomycetes bacterium]